MWRLVRESVRFHGKTLRVAWCLCLIGIAMVFAILTIVGVVPPGRAVLWGVSVVPFYLLLASAIPGWMALGTDATEKRTRLTFLLPLSTREIGLARQLVPTVLLACGVPVAHAVAALVRLGGGEATPWLRHDLIALVAAHLFCVHQLSFAVMEVAYLGEGRWWRSIPGTLAVLAVLFGQVLLGLPGASNGLRALAVTALGALVGAAALLLFTRRRELAR